MAWGAMAAPHFSQREAMSQNWVFRPLGFLVAVVADWILYDHQKLAGYLIEESRILIENLGAREFAFGMKGREILLELSMPKTSARILVRSWFRSTQKPERLASAFRFSSLASTSVSNRAASILREPGGRHLSQSQGYSSSLRKASNPASDVTVVPRNSSFRRRSKSSRRGLFEVSPIGRSPPTGRRNG
jgi:hypothetical protein